MSKLSHSESLSVVSANEANSDVLALALLESIHHSVFSSTTATSKFDGLEVVTWSQSFKQFVGTLAEANAADLTGIKASIHDVMVPLVIVDVLNESIVVVAERKRLSTTEVEQYVAIDILNEIAFSAPGVGESKNVVGILVSVDIRSSENGLVPLAGKVSALTLSLGEDALGPPSANT